MSTFVSRSPPEDKIKPAPKTKDSKRKKHNKKGVNGNTTIVPIDPLKSHPEKLRDEIFEANKNKEILQARNSLESPENRGNNGIEFLSHSKDPVMSTTASETNNTSTLIEADSGLNINPASRERENLRSEVERLRRALEEIQNQHASEFDSIKRQHTDELSEIKIKQNEEIFTIKKEHSEELATLKIKLEESEKARDTAETQYQHLLERVNTIKSSLGERFKADKQELGESKLRIKELESLTDSQTERINHFQTEIDQLRIEHQELLKEVCSLQHENNLSEQNLSLVREDMALQTRKLKIEVDAAKEATEGWEMLAMEERAMREVLVERNKELEEQMSSHREALDAAILERQKNLETLETVQRSFHDSLESRNRENQELVESHASQLKALRSQLQSSDSRAAKAESSRDELQAEIERIKPLEGELKEKNLLIGKLRHEAIVLNDHLTKALRFLKKSRPEDNIDRQIVTNHFLHFLALERSDPKKFQVLQLIASLLNWTDEQKEQAGLARPGTSNSSHRFPSQNFHHTASTTSLSAEISNDSSARKESFADLWKSFLERSAEESELQNRSGSVNIIQLAKTEGEK